MQQGGSRLAAWLAEAGAPGHIGERISQTLGERADERVAENPWCVLEVPGVAPPAADALARAALAAADPADPRRTRALVGWLLQRAAAEGSTAQGADVVAQALRQAGVEDPTGAIADAIENGAALAFAEPVTLPPDADEAQAEDFEELDGQDDDDPAAMLTSARTLLAAERWTFAEQAVAEAAQRLAATPDPLAPEAGADPADPLTAAAAAHGLTLVTGADAERLAALAGAFPGCVLVSPAAAGVRTLAAAGAPAQDARGLGGDPGRIAAADLLIVADAQLVDLELGATLLESARDGAHVVLAGDPATPPSAAPGLFFRDLLAVDEPEFGGRLPRVELKRRPTGPLSALADAVRHGGLPPRDLLVPPGDTSRELVIVPVRDPGEALHRAVQLAADSIPRTFELPGDQIQVLAVAAGGAAGVNALNAALKQRFNPGPGACAGFDAGDRVVAAAPPAHLGLLPGESGTVTESDAQGLTFSRRQPGAQPLRLTAAEARALRHAWALSVAQAQGGRWAAVVAVFDAESAGALSRALVLGAITAATRHLSIVHGAGRALAEAVENVPDHPRRTRLRHALRD